MKPTTGPGAVSKSKKNNLLDGELKLVEPKVATKKSANPPDPNKFWGDFFAEKDVPSTELFSTISTLYSAKKFRDVEAALRAYLIHRPTNAEAWMYEMLSVVIEANVATDPPKTESAKTKAMNEAKLYLGYAAKAALKSRDATQLVSVADKLHLRGRYEEEGPLLDLACELIPHRGEPNMMQINLAAMTKESKRMGDAIERLLSLGWLGRDVKGNLLDDKVRRDARAQAEQLAKSLKEEGKDAEADALTTRLPDAEARDLYVRLTWKGTADLDMTVAEPLGATAKYGYPRTVFGGALLVNGEPPFNQEIYSCPRAFSGKYTIKIEAIFNDPEHPVKEATLEILTHEGTHQEEVKTLTIALPAAEPVVVELKDGRRKEVLPFVAPAIVEIKKSDPKKIQERVEAKKRSDALFNDFLRKNATKK